MPPIPLLAVLGSAGALARVPFRRPRAGAGDSSSNAWERALDGPGCELVTVVGDAGVGKSRLVAEALISIDARVVRGRCLPYGEGITYWPVIEVVKQLARAAVGSGRRGGRPFAARRERPGHERRPDRLGVSEAARGAGAARRRLRRHPVGRGDLPRPGRGDRAAHGRRTDSAALHGAAGAARAPSRLAGRAAARAR